MKEFKSTVRGKVYASAADKEAKKLKTEFEEEYTCKAFEASDWAENSDTILKLANAKYKINQDDEQRAKHFRRLGDYRYRGKSKAQVVYDNLVSMGVAPKVALSTLSDLGLSLEE